jgi:hypothetical protein
VIFSVVGTIAQHHGRSCRGLRSLFSYPKYNRGDFNAQTNAVRAASFVEKGFNGAKPATCQLSNRRSSS